VVAPYLGRLQRKLQYAKEGKALFALPEYKGHVRCFTEPATTKAAEAGCRECIICERSFSDETGQDMEPSMKMICGYYTGED
jgi:hypothetical protein